MSFQGDNSARLYGLMYLMSRYAARPASWLALVIVHQLETFTEKQGRQLDEAEQLFFLGQLAIWRSRLALHVSDTAATGGPALPRLVELARQV